MACVAPEDSQSSIACCILGHANTGKTMLLNCIRGQEHAKIITQQITATYIPPNHICEKTKQLKSHPKLNIPGLLLIDTPGHESFKKLRSQGSHLSHIAILVVDIKRGVQTQTIESLHLLRSNNINFVVAINKVDSIYEWKSRLNEPICKAMMLQNTYAQHEFNSRLTHIITQFKDQGFDTELYYKNKHWGETFSIVPTSAVSGEGIPELLLLLAQSPHMTMPKNLVYNNDIRCMVLGVKVIEGLGTTIDVILVNGVLHKGDEIIVCGFRGPIHTTIQSLLTPHPLKELEVKGTYVHHKEIKAVRGINITTQNLEHAVAGTTLYVVGPDDDVKDLKESVMNDVRNVMKKIDRSGEGIYVQASTLGSVEALLEFLKMPDVNIPVSGIGLGPIHKKDVMKASVMLEKKKEFAAIVAFDVNVIPEARELADGLGVKILEADIFHHLVAKCKAYINLFKEEEKKNSAEDATFPCVLKIMPNRVLKKNDPIILDVNVHEGILKVGTPICIPQKDFINIGRISSIKENNNLVDSAEKGHIVSIKIEGSNAEEKQKMFGIHFTMQDELVSYITRKSIDALKDNYRAHLSTEQWRLVVKLKHLIKVP